MTVNAIVYGESAASRLEELLVTLCDETYADPLRFVQAAYPWPIAGLTGPDPWQADELEKIGRSVRERAFHATLNPNVPPYRAAWSTGHGVGKTSLLSWVVNWIMSTRPHCRGSVTANTNDQLRDKTWAAVREWTGRCATRHWFEINSEVMYRKGHRGTWFCVPLSCAPENADAYQGQHARGSTSFYLLDEASGIDRRIWEAAEGGLTDGEPLIICGGQMLRNSGAFWEACFGRGRELWHPRVVDARETGFANEIIYDQWATTYGGEDSDYYRVRVRGLPPRASDLQYIDQERILAAQRREMITVFEGEPLIAGVDFSGGGRAWNVVRLRRGMDAQTIPPIRVPGGATRDDRSAFLSVLANLLADRTPERKLAAMFCDSAYGDVYVALLNRMGYTNAFEVKFGNQTSPDEAHCENMRAYMWREMKEWLAYGAIPPDDARLEADLSAPGHHLNRRDRLVIEAKEEMAKRGVASPDDADALALTFAAPLGPRRQPPTPKTRRQRFAGRGPQSGRDRWTH